MKPNRYLSFIFIFLLTISFLVRAQTPVLKAADFKHYINSFNREDNELYKQYYPNDKAWTFLQNNIPFFECPDKQLEQTYYFRWWTFRKHIKKTPDGFIITEFLPSVEWAAKYNSINCAAGHHIYEGRWLHDSVIIKDYINFWFKRGGGLRSYSTWIADALYKYSATRGDFKLATDLLPDLVKNYGEWEKSNYTGEGLFWSEDDRDGMEVSVSGSGLRPTLNSYMYADAGAIAGIASLAGDKENTAIFLSKAGEIKKTVLQKLWDKDDHFFKVIPLKNKEEKINASQTFRDYGKQNVRELLGYTPWYAGMVDSSYASAWKQLLSSKGFYAPYGLTTTEQRNAGFHISYRDHECQWNGPSWPFSTSITLTALSNVLHDQSQPYISKKDYFSLLRTYSRAHKLTREGKKVPWIDENLNPFTGDWISRTRLKKWKNGTWSDEKGGVERGKDYNHSTFCDLIITGLIGLRTAAGDTLIIDPLIPDNQWDYFCLDNVLYHGKTLTILYDKTGKKYNRGKGFLVFVNNKKIASSGVVKKIICKINDGS